MREIVSNYRLFLIGTIASALVGLRAHASVSDAGKVVASTVLTESGFDGLDLSDPSTGEGKDKKHKKGEKKSEKGEKSEKGAKNKKKGKKGKSSSGDSSDLPTRSTTAPATTAAPAVDSPASPAVTAPSSTSTGAATPAAEPKKEKAAPVMTFDVVDVSGKSAERQRIDAAIKVFNDENYETASLAFMELLKDSKMSGFHDEAEYLLAKTLYRMKMYHSSLNHFKVILAKGPSNRFFKSGLEWLFFIARKTVNEQIVLDEVAKWSNQEFPDRFRSEFRYLLARYHFARGKALDEAGQGDESKKSLDETKRLAMAVSKSDPFYARAKYLEGTVNFKEGSFAASLEAFKEVVRANNPRNNPNADLQLRELAFMQLARTHYGHLQNRYAIFYYDKVQPGSDQWLEALFEASWAHFRIGNYERALGNLITLSSPFFKDEYFPEALILKAVIYYENCRYREARAILEEFERTYMPVHNELVRITGQNTDAQRYYDILADIQKRNQDGGKGTTLLLERILKLALTDTNLKLVNESILEVEKEMDSVAEKKDLFRYSDLAKKIGEELKVERAALMSKAGILAKAKLEFELGQLKELLGNALRIRFETTTQEKKFLEDQLLAGGKKDILKAYKYSVAVSDERLYWPYEGEYWRDELGTYEYTLTKGCKGR